VGVTMMSKKVYQVLRTMTIKVVSFLRKNGDTISYRTAWHQP